MRSRRRFAFAVPLVVGLSGAWAGAGVPGEVSAQPPGEASVRAPAATPLLPADHWVRPILHRLDASGLLTPGRDPGASTWTLGDARSALDEVVRPSVAGARDDAGAADPGAADLGSAAVESARSLARLSLTRLEAELDGSHEPVDETAAPRVQRRPGGGAGFARLPGWLQAGAHRVGGALVPAYDTSAVGPPVAPRPGEEGWEAEVTALVALRMLPWLAAEVRPAVGTDGVRLVGASALASAGPLRLWGGRRSVRYGPGAATAGLLLGHAPPLDAVAVALAPGRRFPTPLSWLGPLNAETLVARVDEAGASNRPWLWAFRASLRPHARLRLAVERAALIGGEGTDVDAGDVLDVLVGRHGDDSGIANQILAVDVAFRPPLGRLPLSLFGAVGTDDSAGAWHDVPAWTVGAEIPIVPGVPWMGLAVERAAFSRSCCGNPPWYRHLQLPWIADGRLLGHPLGGHGSEWRARARGDWPARRVEGTLAIFTRDRGAENLYAPDRVGHSAGAKASFRLLGPWARGEVLGGAAVERAGSSWRETRFFVGARHWF